MGSVSSDYTSRTAACALRRCSTDSARRSSADAVALPFVAFLKPTGAESAEAICRCNGLSTVRAPIASHVSSSEIRGVITKSSSRAQLRPIKHSAAPPHWETVTVPFLRSLRFAFAFVLMV